MNMSEKKYIYQMQKDSLSSKVTGVKKQKLNAFVSSGLSKNLSRALFFVLLLTQQLAFSQERPFITTWSVTDDDEITIPVNPSFTYNFNYVWKDVDEVVVESGTHTSTEDVPESFSTGFTNAGSFTLEITGDFPHFQGYPKDKLTDVNQWGDIVWRSFEESFRDWSGTTFNASDTPIFDENISMLNAFRGAASFNGDLSEWNVENVVNMSRVFQDAVAFNGDLSEWDVGKVTTMVGLFENARSFNGDVSNWNVSNVTNMESLFFRADSFS
ncbi:MAG: BspA family leucine-rich repeat surface protein [Bacteroidota bacterium]